MMDETIANAHPINWGRVRELEASLVAAIGSPDFNHVIADPIPLLRNLSRGLKNEDFSSVIDLTGWMTPALQELFPQIPVDNSFSLSRVRVVSSPGLETTGYKVSLFPEEVEDLRERLDLEKPLIVDDVSFSGWTSKKTMDILGINPASATHAFLLTNDGDLGNNPGAVGLLQGVGGRVISGGTITTPQDDGWHLKDLHQNPNLSESFVLSMLFQEIVGSDGMDSQSARDFFRRSTVMRIIFPDHLTSDQIRRLMNEGRFITKDGNPPDGNEIHARNPFLWASPYFQAHVDMAKVIANNETVIKTLGELRSLTSDSQGRDEASLELQRVVRSEIAEPVEGNLGRRERL